MEIAVGRLKVIMYVPIQCSKHTWNLTIKPIQGCPYYRCIINNDASIYNAYMALWAKRTPTITMERPYSDFISLFDSIQARGYIPERPVTVYQDVACLEDGHHRASIICALYGPEYKLHIEVLKKAVPCDIEQCSNPCPS
jgi:hypothetical protein